MGVYVRACCVCACVHANVCVRERGCGHAYANAPTTDLLSGLVVVAPLQRYLKNLVADAHVELAAAVQDQQAADVLPLPGREQLNLLQQAVPHGLVQRGEHLPDSAIV